MHYSQDPLGLTSHTRAYTYTVTVPPANLPVSLEDVKEQLRIPDSDTTDDDLLTLYINAATNYAEAFTRRDFITRTYETYRDYFPGTGYYFAIYTWRYPYTSGNVGFEIRRSQLQSIESIEYIVNDVFTPVDPSIYYNTTQNDFSVVLTEPDNLWPNDADRKLQSVKITFKAGYGDTEADVPDDIKVALTQIVTALYENRGDCSECDCEQFAPIAAKLILKQNRILNI
jgi:hypothetical protein